MKIVTSGFGNVPRLAKQAVAKSVNLRTAASCFVISSCNVQTLPHMQSFFGGGGNACCGGNMIGGWRLISRSVLSHFSSQVSYGTRTRRTPERRPKRNQEDV